MFTYSNFNSEFQRYKHTRALGVVCENICLNCLMEYLMYFSSTEPGSYQRKHFHHLCAEIIPSNQEIIGSTVIENINVTSRSFQALYNPVLIAYLLH